MRWGKPTTYVLFEGVTLRRESERAILVDFGAYERWVPKSQMRGGGVEGGSEIGEQFDLEVSDWLSRQWDEEGPPKEGGGDRQDHRPPVIVRDVVVLRETDKGLQIRVASGDPVWIPVKGVHPDSPVRHDGDAGHILLLAWCAKAKGFENGERQAPAVGRHGSVANDLRRGGADDDDGPSGLPGDIDDLIPF